MPTSHRRSPRNGVPGRHALQGCCSTTNHENLPMKVKPQNEKVFNILTVKI
jgi:hypothetical protein